MTISAAVVGSFFPALIRNGTPAQRDVSNSSLRAANVSTVES
jgi:hypothetical protein